VSEPASGASQRLDTWLWCARVAKTRTACADLAARGRVRINRQPTDKPHAKVRPGDVLTLSERRGPPDTARALYEDLAPPPEA